MMVGIVFLHLLSEGLAAAVGQSRAFFLLQTPLFTEAETL